MTKVSLALGLKLLAAFFSVVAVICLLTIVMLLFAGSSLYVLWRLNPDAELAFQTLGKLSIVLMAIVGMACAFTATGLARGARWGIHLALIVLSANLVGDSLNAFLRHDL